MLRRPNEPSTLARRPAPKAPTMPGGSPRDRRLSGISRVAALSLYSIWFQRRQQTGYVIERQHQVRRPQFERGPDHLRRAGGFRLLNHGDAAAVMNGRETRRA